MENKKNSGAVLGIIITIIIVVLVIVVVARPKTQPQNSSTNPPSTSDQSSPEQAVRATIDAFGGKMQQVSLLAPADALKTSMESAYGQYATADAIAKWEADPSSAPGRLTSSPWPDHIDVTNVSMTSDVMASVQGNVVELTSNEVEHGGASDQYPVTITLVQQNGAWLISDFEKNTSNQ